MSVAVDDRMVNWCRSAVLWKERGMDIDAVRDGVYYTREDEQTKGDCDEEIVAEGRRLKCGQ